MVYLYAALGAVMMAGIMAIFEMGLSLTGQSLQPTPLDVYFDNPPVAKDLDEELLKLFANPGNLQRGLSGQALCDAINQAGLGQFSFDPIVNKKAPWNQGCQFQTFFVLPGPKTVSHKILIKPSERANASHLPYELFSCTSASDGYKCLFEPREVDS